MLGLFDSGLGGLTVLRRVRERLPSHDMLYLADQAHVPYGDREFDDLHGLLGQNLTYLDENGAEAIVVACNTSCGVASRLGWPPSSAPVLDLIAVAADAVARLGARWIGVIATSATVRSGAYGTALRMRIDGAQVQEIAAPALVPLVESGQIDGPAARDAVRAACYNLSRRLDVVILACTHYPVLDEHFAEVLGPNILRLDPALAQADAAAHLVATNAIAPGSGRIRYATTGDAGRFREQIVTLTGDEAPEVMHATGILSRPRR